MAINKKYKKRVEIVDAVQYKKGLTNIKALLSFAPIYHQDESFYIDTIDGEIEITNGDYIVEGYLGNFYVYKENEFLRLYEEA